MPHKYFDENGEQIMPDGYDDMDGEEIMVYGYLPDGKGWRCKMWGGLYMPQPPLSPEEIPLLKALREQTGYKEDEE